LTLVFPASEAAMLTNAPATLGGSSKPTCCWPRQWPRNTRAKAIAPSRAWKPVTRVREASAIANVKGRRRHVLTTGRCSGS
jgi:hypothetical protein